MFLHHSLLTLRTRLLILPSIFKGLSSTEGTMARLHLWVSHTHRIKVSLLVVIVICDILLTWQHDIGISPPRPRSTPLSFSPMNSIYSRPNSSSFSFQSPSNSPELSLPGFYDHSQTFSNSRHRSNLASVSEDGSESGSASPRSLTDTDHSYFNKATTFRFHPNKTKLLPENLSGEDLEKALEPIVQASSFICSVCGKKSKRKTAHRAHVKIHIPNLEKKFKCETCGIAFLRKHHLTRHKIIHASEKPYNCECGRGFNRRDAYQRHQADCTKSKDVWTSWCSRLWLDRILFCFY